MGSFLKFYKVYLRWSVGYRISGRYVETQPWKKAAVIKYKHSAVPVTTQWCVCTESLQKLNVNRTGKM